MVRTVRKKGRKAREPVERGTLELIPVSVAELPLWLMKRLYFRPDAVRKDLTTKEKKRHEAAGGGSAASFLYPNVWATEETVVNKCLEALLMAAPPAALATAVNTLVPGAGLEVPAVCSLKRNSKLRTYTGETDLALYDKGRRALVLGEIKIGAKASNGRYSLQQLRKYMQLGMLARAALGLKRVRHLIVLPQADIERQCRDSKEWRPEVGRRGRLRAAHPGLARTITGSYRRSARKMAAVVPVKFENLVQPLAKGDPIVPIDTYVVTWEQLCTQLAAALEAEGAGHLKGACEILRTLGEGSFKGRSP